MTEKLFFLLILAGALVISGLIVYIPMTLKAILETLEEIRDDLEALVEVSVVNEPQEVPEVHTSNTNGGEVNEINIPSKNVK